MHPAEVVPDDADPSRIHAGGRVATRSTQRRRQRDVADDPLAVRGRSRSGRPPTGTSAGAGPPSRLGRRDPVDGLVDELGPVAVRCVGVEPVGEDEAGRRRAGVDDGRLDQVRLDRPPAPPGATRMSRTRTPSRSSAPTDLERRRAGRRRLRRSGRHGHDADAPTSWRFRPSMPVVEPEPLADERQEPRPALVRRRHQREPQPRERRRRIAGQPPPDRRSRARS